jgi:hypothetical protein
MSEVDYDLESEEIREKKLRENVFNRSLELDQLRIGTVS